jgi:hypothetical protein
VIAALLRWLFTGLFLRLGFINRVDVRATR